MAALTPEPLLLRDNATIIDFRAPPPSPVASGRRSSVRNEDVLSDFLQNSLQVPDLILPTDRVFPRQKISIQNPPKIDMSSLNSLEENEVNTELIECLSQTGCFEVINHGIPQDLIIAVLDGADGIFGISSEKRKQVLRSMERPFGFEEFRGEEERESSEEFIWCRDERLKMDMEEMLPYAYSNFSVKMEKLVLGMEDVAEKLVQFLQQNSLSKKGWGINGEVKSGDREYIGSICYLHKHYCSRIMSADQKLNSLKYDAIKMLIGGSLFPHALSLHLCNGSDAFNIFSKKGWASFQPTKHSLFICLGDALQAWSGGKMKHVFGQPVFERSDRDYISIAFMYPPKNKKNMMRSYSGKVEISLCQQIFAAIVLSLLYHFVMIFYKYL